MNDTLDKMGGPKHKNAQARNSVISHMNILKLKAIFRLKHPLAKSFTRIQFNRRTATRLDFFLVSEHLCGKVRETEIKASVKSDHKISTIAIDVAQIPQGPGFWKLNTGLCYDRNYVQHIKRCINEYIINNPEGDVNPRIRWNALKCYLRECTVVYSKNKMKQITSYRKNLQNLLQNTENLLISVGDQHQKRLRQTLIALQQNDLDKHFEHLDQGQIFRSRAKWAELGEKNTKYFLNLEKHHATKKAVFKLQSANGITTDQKEILTLIKKFLFFII